ncbi:MAG: DUF3465 domain-containing protein [Aeromonadaceae bacterium]|nr:DUF3465 domain-containing protein [Aeromonadaceae bacterium]MBP8772329.1 DUF3465 domain-containing protein [Aeromonadaceae bacterium]
MQRSSIVVLGVLVICLLGYVGIKSLRAQMVQASAGESWRQAAKRDESIVAKAYQQGKGDVQVTVSGRIIQVLPANGPDDAHQRFTIEIGNGMTLQVMHDSKMAGVIPDLAYGSQATVAGFYVWNPSGGELHDRYQDPQGEWVTGWIEYAGRRYP